MTPVPSGRRPEQVVDVELGLAEEDVGALLLEGHDRAQEHPERGARHPAVLVEDRLALVRAEVAQGRRQVGQVEQRQLVVVAVLEDQAEDRGLGVVEVEDLAQEERAEAVDGGPDLGAELPAERQELDRVAGGLERPAEARAALDDLRVGRVAGDRQAGQVALDVGDEAGNAGLRQLAGHDLEGLGLAGAGRPGDEPVPVEHRQADLDPDVGRDLGAEHRAAEDDGRLGRVRSRPPSRRGTPGPRAPPWSDR